MVRTCLLTVGMTLGIRGPAVGPLKDVNFRNHSGTPWVVLGKGSSLPSLIGDMYTPCSLDNFEQYGKYIYIYTPFGKHTKSY